MADRTGLYALAAPSPDGPAPNLPPRYAQNPYDLDAFLKGIRAMRAGANERLPGSMFNISPYFDQSLRRDVPVYGASIPLGGGLAISGQYQTAPSRPDNYGFALRYRKEF